MSDASARWRRVEALCDAALERDPETRAVFLASACGDDEGLRREVESLLAHAQTSEGFLDAPVGAIAAGVLGTDARAGRRPGTVGNLSGRRLGSYDVIAPLGAGGMGEVYRARDTKLGRDVAIKVLPESFVHDRDRIARFRREAQVLASLNHPHIAAIYGLEEGPPPSPGQSGGQFLVLELVEGQTLAQRLTAGPLPLDEALAIAKQIAEALDAAHDKGIIHRDLKPANIVLTADGNVKVLDFGLAKAIEQGSGVRGQGSGEAANSPTLTSPALMTGAGVILGTAGYMSPEQSKGREADKRSDLWAFGCVLYEMLTGRPAFEGEDLLDTLTATMRSEPDWAVLPADTPAHVRTLLEQCLKKDRKQRISDIAVAQFLLDAPPTPLSDDPLRTAAVPAPASMWHRVTALMATAMVAAVIGAWLWSLRSTPAASPVVTRFAFSLADGERFTAGERHTIAISPDGTQVAYVANSRLYLRAMSESASRTIPGTDLPGGVNDPVFSPDGRSIAFGTPSDNTLKRVSIAGGTPVAVCACGGGYANGISWGPGGIVLANYTLDMDPRQKGILRVSPNGGPPEVLVAAKADERPYGAQILPGGETLLFTLRTGQGDPGNPSTSQENEWDKAQIVAESLTSGARQVLIDGGSDARYVRTGHLVYARAGVLFAVPFDVRRVEVTGRPVPVVEGVARSLGNAEGAAQFGISETGSLVYVPGPVDTSVVQLGLGLIPRKGAAAPLNLPPAAYRTARLSPNGKQLAIGTDDGREAAVLVYDMAGASSPRRLTFAGNNRFPIWSADGRRVTFQSDRDGDVAIFWQRSDGSGTAERLTKPDHGVSHIPEAWSPRGETLLFRSTRAGAMSLWALSAADRNVAPFGGIESTVPTDAVFSPDGRWVAYAAFDPARVSQPLRGSVYVQPFPATGAQYEVSRELHVGLSGSGGRHPVWSHDGAQILFIIPGANRYAVAAVTTTPNFGVANPELFTRNFQDSLDDPVRSFDVAADGRILGVIGADQAQMGGAPQQIQMVLNWFEELNARVPSRPQ